MFKINKKIGDLLLQLAIGASFFVGSQTNAQTIFDKCNDAIQADDKWGAKRFASLTVNQTYIPPEQVESARKCVMSYFGDKYTYKESLTRFELTQNIRQIELKEEVVSATVQACNQLYSSDHISALTNPLCNAIFMETGLPK